MIHTLAKVESVLVTTSKLQKVWERDCDTIIVKSHMKSSMLSLLSLLLVPFQLSLADELWCRGVVVRHADS